MAKAKSASARSQSTGAERVRASRDGDRFHYTWAAACLLRLLSPVTGLQQVSIEGLGAVASEEEPDGAEVIDLVEFYGPPGAGFTSLEVRQFKYSTLRPEENFALADICEVLGKFSRLDEALRLQYPRAAIHYSIVTNKPISVKAAQAVRDLATGRADPAESSVAKLIEAMVLSAADAVSLCSRLELRGGEAKVAALRQELGQGIGGLTADADLRASASLIDLVASRASTESNGPITKADVLAAFGCREDELAPAPGELGTEPFFVRDAYIELAHKILDTPGAIILTAEGGVGKSTFTRSLPGLLGGDADVIIYDCFGGGKYRRPGRPRHRHRDGLVQIATEISGAGLALPIIPAGRTDPEEYVKAFVRRLETASETLAQRGNRQLVVIVDAADNAAIAAEENADYRAFVRDLLRLEEAIPANIHIVLTCRPERIKLLEPPSRIVTFELAAFQLYETAKVVSSAQRAATPQDIAEIHDRTAGNPRVLSTVLIDAKTTQDVLERLAGLAPNESPLDGLMQAKVDRALEHAGSSRLELERAAQLLTLLRPRVPLNILAELAGTQVASVRSFISDLGRGLILDQDSVQFLDEPTETYFQTWHRATREVAAQAATKLQTLSAASSYAASSLPEVLWSAGLHDELLALVTTSDALPSTSDVERTQVENLRVEFGLRAAVQLRRADSIVQLALRAGSGRAGKGRQFALIRDNPDIAGSQMEPRVLGELVAARDLPQTWPGSTIGTEAALLAHSTGSASAARSRARQADSAITAWTRTPKELSSQNEDVTPEQVAHIAIAILRTDGPADAARYLSRWHPPQFVLESSAALAQILISTAGDEDLTGLVSSSIHPALLLGVFGEMQRVGMSLDAKTVGDVWATIERFRVPLVAKGFDLQNAEDTALRGASWICALAVRHSIVSATVAAGRLRECLPLSLPIGLGDRHGSGRGGLLFAVALCVELEGKVLDVAHYRPLKNPAKRGRYDPARANDEDLDRYLRPALVWLSAWVKYARGNLDPQASVAVITSYPKHYSQGEIWSMANRIARQVLPLLGVAAEDDSVTDACVQAIQKIANDAPIAGAVDLLMGLRGDGRYASVALELSSAAHHALAGTPEAADSKAETLVRIARGLHRFSRAEAASYFDHAVRTATGVGDDAIRRWDAILGLTRAAAGVESLEAITLAERVARLGEVIEPIVYDGFDQRKLATALAKLSGSAVFGILGQWRDRRFGTLAWQLDGLVGGDDPLLASRPDLKIVLAPFSDSVDLSDALRELDASGRNDARILSAVNNLAGRLGRSLDAGFAQSSLPDLPSANDPEEFETTAYEPTPDEQVERTARIARCKAQIATLDLTQIDGVEKAVRLQEEAHSYGDSLFVAEVFSRPELQWGAILSAALSSDALGDYELAKLLNEALMRPRTSQSFVSAMKKAVTTYTERHGARLLQHNWVSFDLPAAAALLGVRTTDLLQHALDHLNVEEALTDADHCYMLAAGASEVLKPSTAAHVLEEALTALEEELGIEPREDVRQMPADPIDVAVSNFLWAALGDTRSAVRWRAAHAVRVAIEIGLDDVIIALGEAAVRGEAAGHADERFLHYQMSATEWFLIAIERVARDNPSAVEALMLSVIELSERYPDHAMIQSHCFSIARLAGASLDRPVGTDWKATLRESVTLESWRRPSHPSPMMQGAPKSEYRFHSDFDEYVLGKLTEALVITHQEVLDAASNLILDEWGWRTSGTRLEDPRRTAGVYEDGETYGYKWEVPKAEDLDYYLERHAALTIAGRLMRTVASYRDPDAEQPDILGWLADFDIARDDGRWVTDQRSAIPSSLVSVGPRGKRGVDESEYLTALQPADGWITVWQSASVTEYDRSLNINVSSAVVNPKTVGALLRALQSGPGYWSFRIPSADLSDEDFQFSSPPFELRGWVSTSYSEGGIDRLDPFAADLTADLPRPSEEFAEVLGTTPGDGGRSWRGSGEELVLASETWAEMSLGRDRRGPSGCRLRIRTEALDELLERLDVAFIVEVRVCREGRGDRHAEVLDDDDQGGDVDRGNEFRIFSYQPGTGWSDLNGSTRTG